MKIKNKLNNNNNNIKTNLINKKEEVNIKIINK